ncbi:MAG: superfamily I DNA/RNA helicase [Bacillota bacterium]|nr:MAG: superfamily I DNA/RNA helicase [Bacillota bacterium]
MDITTKLEGWKHRLLDLGKRNRMLYYKPTKRSSLQLLEPDAYKIFDRLVVEERTLEIVNSTLTQVELFPEESSSKLALLKQGQVQPSQEGAELGKTLYQLRLRARTSIQERGVNVLYLSFGMLEWRESDQGEIVRSPLLLVPVELQHSSILDPHHISLYENEVTLNPTLLHKLANDFGVTLPSIPDDNEWDLVTYLKDIERLVTRKGWSVAHDVVLGLFSFLKLNMYKDLEACADRIVNHPLVNSVAGDSSAIAGPDADIDMGLLDRASHPTELFQVVDADSSQQEAIEYAKRGVSYVLQGPPGTGKSQTITNIVAEALAAGKRVLFVSEKMAALEVVYKRIKAAGLGDFCLQLHSHKANKREVIEELGRTLYSGRTNITERVELELERLQGQRNNLNNFVDGLHESRQPLDMSVYEVYGELAKLGHYSDHTFELLDVGRISKVEKYQLTQKLRELALSARRVGLPYLSNIWRGSAVKSYSLELQQTMRLHFSRLKALLQTFMECNTTAIEELGLPAPVTFAGAEHIAKVLQHAASSPMPPSDWFSSDCLHQLAEEAAGLRDLSAEYHLIKCQLLSMFAPGIMEIDEDLVESNLKSSSIALQTLLKQTDSNLSEALLIKRNELTEIVESVLRDFSELSKALAPMATVMDVHEPRDFLELQRLLSIAQLIIQKPKPIVSWFESGMCERLLSVVDAAKIVYEELDIKQTELLQRYDKDALSIDTIPMIKRFRTEYVAFFRFIKPSFHRDMKCIRGFLKDKSLSYEQALSDLQLIRQSQDGVAWVSEHQAELGNSLGSWFKGGGTEWRLLKKALLTMIELLAFFSTDDLPSGVQHLLLGTVSSTDLLKTMIADVQHNYAKSSASLSRFVDILQGRTQENFEQVIATATNVGKQLTVFYSCYDNVWSHSVAEGGSLETTYGVTTQVARLNLIDAVIAKRECELMANYGQFYKGIGTEWEAVLNALQWTWDMVGLFGNSKPSSQFVRNICVNSTRLTDISVSASRCESMLREMTPHIEFVEKLFSGLVNTPQHVPLDELGRKVAAWLENIASMEDWIDFQGEVESLKATNLNGYVEAILNENLPSDQIVPVFEKRFLSLWLDNIFSSSPQLGRFRGDRHNVTVAEFKAADENQLRLAQARLRAKLSATRPNPYQVNVRDGEISILTREIEKRKRHKPLRKLFAMIPNLLLTLKPCLLMSPLSISQFLEPHSIHFDLVLFDEASQVLVEDAIGAIFRADQMVVVGDKQQLPPTNFFKAGLGDAQYDDSAEEEDDEIFESILDACSANMPRKSLRWHYRSRHEHLIAFSNAKFYRDLITFPSPSEADDLGVQYVFVPDGVYDRGGTRINRQEASQVVTVVKEHFVKYPNRSLGVVTFSEAQQSAIDEELRRLRMSNPTMEKFFQEDREEAFFVKNLENVQGDERDTIIFSTGYGKDRNGIVHMNFGPLSSDGGERRLNVAITRARYNVKVVTSLRPTDIDLERSDKAGVKLLRQYLEFAIHGPESLARELKVHSEKVFDSPFEEVVYHRLVTLGYEVDTQVGCSAYRIDLAIRDRNNPGQYLLGIECDGRTYHSAKTARDRDRLRQAVLIGLGWNIHRIWSTDWIKDPEAELRRIEQTLASVRLNANVELQTAATSAVSNSGSEEDDLFGLEDSFSLEDEAATGNPGVSDYEIANIDDVEHKRGMTPGFYVGSIISHVVNLEGPIHIDVLARRTATVFGREKGGSTVKTLIKEYIMRYCAEQVAIKGLFYWPKEMEAPRVRSSIDGLKPRTMAQICVEERVAAVLLALTNSVALTLDDLCVETSRLLGYNRTSQQIRDCVIEALESAEREGIVEMIDDKVRIKRLH